MNNYILLVPVFFFLIGGILIHLSKKKELKNKPKQELKSKTKYIKYVKEKFEVGMTFIEITFLDKRKFTTCVYGEVNQFINYDNSNLLAADPEITNSNVIAEHFIKSLNGSVTSTFVDDPKFATESIMGVPIKATIKETMDCEEERNIARVFVEE